LRALDNPYLIGYISSKNMTREFVMYTQPSRKCGEGSPLDAGI